MKFIRMVTLRGFGLIEFKDLYDKVCSIQESSLATQKAIWLGVDKGTHHLGRCAARMHLNQRQMWSLLPILLYFAIFGTLPRRKKE